MLDDRTTEYIDILPDLNEVEDEENTGSWGPFYWTSLTPSDVQPLISTAWTREVEAPWRRGRSLAVRIGGKLYTAGIWIKGKAPSEAILEEGSIDIEVLREW